MNKKNVGTLLLLVATALGGPPAAYEAAVDSPEAKIELVGPTSAEVGQLVRLQYPGRSVEWILPTEDTADVSADEVVLSFRKPGEYQVVAAAKVGDSVQVVTHDIVVGGDKPRPEPRPEPRPSPATPELTQDVYEWCKESSADKETCLRLADNFIDAASTTSTVEELLVKTAELNRGIDQTGVQEVLTEIQKLLVTEFPGKSYVDHQCAWDEIATGLQKWGNS